MDYRVKEHLGRFKIQVKNVTTKTKGYLWWKKTEKETKWVMANDRGEPFWVAAYIPVSPPPARSFKTLEEALAQIEIFKTPPKYHEA